MRIHDVLSTQEVRELIQPSDLRGWMAVLTTWGIILGSFLACALWPSVGVYFLAWILLGGRHLALAILMHDCAHYSLFKTRSLNDIVGRWLCAYPTWQDLRRYRPHHITHHKNAGTPQDPDLDLVTAYPTSTNSLIRKLLRDLSGVSGIKRVYGLLLMDLGYIGYTVSSRVEKIDQTGRKFSDVLKTGIQNLHGVLITNVVLFFVLKTSGHPGLYLLWVWAFLSSFGVFVRIRSIAEHACTELNLDPLKSTRTTYAHPIARLTVAPHRVNYHLEHHLAMTIPYFNLKRTHELLRSRGALQGAYLSSGYWDVLKQAVSQKEKPA